MISLKDEPRPVGIFKLTNEESFKLRIGDYRILYTIDDDLKEIRIFKVAHRKNVYRKK